MVIADRIIHNPNSQEFVLEIDNTSAFISYENNNETLYLMHSEVPMAYRGQGIGTILVQKTYDYLHENNIEAIPVCSFLKAIVRTNKLQ